MINHVIEVVSELDIDISEFELLIKECVNKTLVFEDIRFPCEVCVLLTDNAGIRELNLTYRKLDKPTDVLSFPMLEPDPDLGLIPPGQDIDAVTGHVMLGDIVISVEKAAGQAEELGHSLKRELAFLSVHAALHLTGYDHERGGDEESRFFSRQKEILNTIGI